MSHHYFEGEHDPRPLPRPKGATSLTIEVKDSETKRWIEAPQVEALGMKQGQLILRATFPLGAQYGGGDSLLTKKARILRNGKKHDTVKFSPIRIDHRVTVLALTFGYTPTPKEKNRLRDLHLPRYSGFINGQGTPQEIDWKEAALYR
jgi:hypothetical protein